MYGTLKNIFGRKQNVWGKMKVIKDRALKQ